MDKKTAHVSATTELQHHIARWLHRATTELQLHVARASEGNRRRPARKSPIVGGPAELAALIAARLQSGRRTKAEHRRGPRAKHRGGRRGLLGGPLAQFAAPADRRRFLAGGGKRQHVRMGYHGGVQVPSPTILNRAPRRENCSSYTPIRSYRGYAAQNLVKRRNCSETLNPSECGVSSDKKHDESRVRPGYRGEFRHANYSVQEIKYRFKAEASTEALAYRR